MVLSQKQASNKVGLIKNRSTSQDILLGQQFSLHTRMNLHPLVCCLSAVKKSRPKTGAGSNISLLIQMCKYINQCNYGNYYQYGKYYLYCRNRTLSVYLSGLSVNHKVIYFIFVLE